MASRQHIASVYADAITTIDLYLETDRGLTYYSADIWLGDSIRRVPGPECPSIGIFQPQILRLAWALFRAWLKIQAHRLRR